MSSAPLSAASATRARNRQAALASSASATARSRDAATALSDRRRRRRSGGGERSGSSADRSGASADSDSPFAFTPLSRRSQQPVQQENFVRGILHKRRDHLTYGSAAWRPRLFVLDKSSKTLTYYLLSIPSSRRREADNSNGGIPTTPIPVRGHVGADASGGLQPPATPLDAAIDALCLDVNPRGILSLRNCIVRAVDDASVDATVRTPGRPRSRANNDGRLFGMVLSPRPQRRQRGSVDVASGSDIKSDIYLATSTEADRTEWLGHLAAACGMAVSPGVPGGLRSASAPPPLIGRSRRREVSEDREGQDVDTAVESASLGTGAVEDTATRKENRTAPDASLVHTPEPWSRRNRPVPSTPATPATTGSPYGSAARRIFNTPSAVAARNEAGNSTSTMSLSAPPLLEVAAILLSPPIIVRFLRTVAPLSLFSASLPQLFLFLLLVWWSIRTIVLARCLGRPVARGGAMHGPVMCRLAVDLTGVLRFLGNKRDERTPLSGTGSFSSLSHISVTHIVAKAIAMALCEVAPELNCRYRTFSLLGLEGWYQNEGGVAVSIVSTSSQRISTIRNAEKCTVQDIADEVWRNQREEGVTKMKRVGLDALSENLLHIMSLAKTSLLNLLSIAEEEVCPNNSCIIYTSPDSSENNEVDIDIAPRPEGGAAPIVVVVGGVRVVDRDPRNSSSRQMRRPMLSVSITIDCPVSSVATCRKLAEKVQQLIQFPEMVE